jgi:hypothetical protein
MKALDDICKKAVSCRNCFTDFNLIPADVDIAQPRWVGQKYWQCNKKIVVMMLNPGSGNFRNDNSSRETRKLLIDYRKGNKSLQEIFDFQYSDMVNWGRARRFLNFLEMSLGLNLKMIALMNFAWCATKDNKYPSYMLNACFSKYGIPLLQVLNPDVVLLCGTNTYKFAKAIQYCLPQTEVISTLHYAHREGAEREKNEGSRIRDLLK